METERYTALAEDYRRVEAAIEALSQTAAQQPALDELAAAVELSPGHLQRVFQRWAGVSPKKFLQFLTVEHAKQILSKDYSVLEASLEAGLSGPSRLHDHFVSLEAVTPGEYKRGGEGLNICTGLHASPFGSMFLAVTQKGVCALHFLDGDDMTTSMQRLEKEWPGATISLDPGVTGPVARRIFARGANDRPLNLLVSGTNFQVRVWRALLEIPPASLATYSDIARNIGSAGATRAVGTAVGANRISWLIPCHRVIRASGVFGSYRWGANRKKLMTAWEQSQAMAIY